MKGSTNNNKILQRFLKKLKAMDAPIKVRRFTGVHDMGVGDSPCELCGCKHVIYVRAGFKLIDSPEVSCL